MAELRLLPDWIGAYMEFTDNTEPPDTFKRWVALSVLAGALQRKCALYWGSETFYPNLYVVLVGPPAARKGTAMRPGRQLLDAIGVPLSADSTTRESLIRSMAESGQALVNPETGLTTMHSSLTVFSPELTVFLGYQNYTLMSDLTDWFDCAPKWEYRTKTQGNDEIIGVYLNLLGATTPDLVRSALPIDAVGGGLTSRIIFIYEPQRGKIVPAPFLSDHEQELKLQLVHDLEAINKLQGEFKVTKNFVDLWIDWYTAQDGRTLFNDKRLATYVDRRQVHVMKLSMLCSVSRSSELKLRESDLQRAIQTLEQAEVKMPQVFGGHGKNLHAATMTAIMNEIALRRSVKVSELMGMFYRDVDQKTFEGIVQTLQLINYIDVEINGNAGDTVLRYRGESTAAINEAIKAAASGVKNE